jgi:hypothetical protein
MAFVCTLGFHSWRGCTCTRCKKNRGIEHAWDGCKCAECGQTRDAEHVWQDCTCLRCSKTRDSGHVWQGCKCSRCAKIRDAEHAWNGCKCTKCGATRDVEHAWSGDLKCTRCGKQQFSDLKYKEREVTNGNTYLVYQASSRARALEFLRSAEVREERKYVVVETREGNLGKDLVMIFDERTSQKIEFAVRKPLPTLIKSRTHCTRCAYPVLPAGASAPGAVELILLDEMKEKGVGFFCRACATAWCPFCVSTETLGSCDICGTKMELFREQ